ncbi:MAG: bifunctional glycosyltransferase family 2/GtrA family protein [Spirochaetes bacterium]|nr:bifunctional glycosyltransferase family 2/GtrA family protein [Spirochaetota bacterium]
MKRGLLLFRSTHILNLLSPHIERLIARVIRAYAPRSSSTLTISRHGAVGELNLSGAIALRPLVKGGDVYIAAPGEFPAAELVISIALTRDDERTARDTPPSGFEIREQFYFGFFILPLLWLRFIPGFPAVLRGLFALETRLHPYLNLLAGVGLITVLSRRLAEPANGPAISCVIPAYNEAQRLPEYLPLIERYFRKRRLKHEIIVVDDGSRDNTHAIISGKFKNVRALKLYQNFGKGAAVREGVMAARGRLVLIADADGATPIEELSKLEAALAAGADAAIGSRYLAASDIGVKQNVIRRIVSRAGNLLIRLLLDLPYKDTQCGFKLFERRGAQYLFRNLANIRFGFDFEILKKAAVLNLSVAEVAVRWNDQEGSKVTFKQTIRVLTELLRFRFSHLLKFAFVGVLNTLVDFTVHNALILALGAGGPRRQLVYMVSSFLCANLFAFCLHSGFTFQRRAAYLRFFTVSVFTLGLAALIFHGLNLLYNPENNILLTNVFKLSTVFVSFVTNYFGYRFWVFRFPV